MNRLEERFARPSVREILNTYEFPKRFVVYFIAQCAKDVLKQAHNTDPKLLKAIEIAERYGNGEDFNQEELEKVHDATRTITLYTPSDPVRVAASYASLILDSICYNRSTGAIVFGYTSYSSPNQAHKPLLLNLIESRMTKSEKLVTFGAK